MKTRILKKISSKTKRKVTETYCPLFGYNKTRSFINKTNGITYLDYIDLLNPLERYILKKRRKKLAIKRKIRRF